MIRYYVSAHKQALITSLFLVSVVLMTVLKFVLEGTGVLKFAADASIEVYWIGILAALLYLHPHWSTLLQGTVRAAPFESTLLAGRLLLTQGACFTLIYFLLQDVATSRSFLIWFLLIGFPINAALITWLPGLFRKMLNRTGSASGILVGKGPLSQELLEYTKKCRLYGLNFDSFYGDAQQRELSFDHKGPVDALTEETLYSDPSIKRMLLFGSNFDDPDFLQALEVCHRVGIRAQVMLPKGELLGSLNRHTVDGDAHFLIMADEPLQNPLNRFIKRSMDILVSLFVLIAILPPLMLVVWLVQRWQSPGPLFFKQTRHGLDRRPFHILKFRTMHVQNEDEAAQATQSDPRIYPFGGLLRRMSLDELPQFINVLQGEMSVIGPRPHLTVHDDLFEKEFKNYRIRHFVKPGITGYAQIRGFRGEVTSPEHIHNRVLHDIHYISNWSLKLDFYIFCKTVLAVFLPPKSAI